MAVGLLAAVAGCAAPTVPNTQWVDPQFTAKPVRSILVVGVAKDAANRRAFEDAMVAQLGARGAKAAPSYRTYCAPPSIYVQDNVIADTRLFEAKGFALVWSASTTTTPGSQSTAALFEQFATLITTTLASDMLI